MTGSRVRVDGRWLHQIARTQGIQWSSRWGYSGICGDAQASWQWNAPGFGAGWFHAGASVEIFGQGRLRWRGRLSEPEPNDTGVACNAYGVATLGAEFPSLVDTDPTAAFAWEPTTIPNTGVDAAISRGLPWVRDTSLGTTAIGVAGDGHTLTVEEVVLRAAKLAGKRAVLDVWGNITLASDPTTPTWLVHGMSNYLGAADDQFVTRLYGYYQSGVNGSGFPVYAPLVYAEDTAAAAKFGQQLERVVDLTELGTITQAAAQANIDGRFALVGGRMGWTAGFRISPLRLRRLTGEQGNAAAVRAGDMVRLPGVRDMRSQVVNRAAADIVLGEARYFDDEDEVEVIPLGYVPRDLNNALAAAQKPSTTSSSKEAA